MPNRILKESICTSDNLNNLTPQEEIFFYRIMVNCDDYGITDARSKILKAKCFPLKEVKDSDIEKWLMALINADLVMVYEVSGKRYLKMTTWENHQQIRAKRSKYPTPDNHCNHLIADDIKCPRNPIQSESNPNPNSSRDNHVTVTQQKENKKYIYTAFEEFWTAYPKKVAKQDATKAWEKIGPDAELTKTIMQGLGKVKQSRQWTEGFIPNASTWLNGRRWEDDYTLTLVKSESSEWEPGEKERLMDEIARAKKGMGLQ